MKKLLSFLMILAMATPSFAANQWRQGSNTDPLEGTTKINDIDTASKNYAFDPLDRLMTNYREGQVLQYASASTLTVTAGEIVVSDVAGTTKLMLRNAANTTVTWTDIDTGAEASSTTYYVYAIAATNADTAVTYKISASASAPTGVTYYKRIGSFYNDDTSNITQSSVTNTNNYYGNVVYDSGWFAWSSATAYLKTHNLGSQKMMVSVFIADDANGTNMMMGGFTNFNDSSNRFSSVMKLITTTTFTLQFGANGIEYPDASGAPLYKTSGYARIIAIAL